MIRKRTKILFVMIAGITILSYFQMGTGFIVTEDLGEYQYESYGHEASRILLMSMGEHSGTTVTGYSFELLWTQDCMGGDSMTFWEDQIVSSILGYAFNLPLGLIYSIFGTKYGQKIFYVKLTFSGDGLPTQSLYVVQGEQYKSENIPSWMTVNVHDVSSLCFEKDSIRLSLDVDIPVNLANCGLMNMKVEISGETRGLFTWHEFYVVKNIECGVITYDTGAFVPPPPFP